MKKLMTIFGALFLSMTILFSCGDDKKSKKSKKDREINIEDLDKNIENEEDAIEAMITIMKAKMELVDKAIGPPLLMMDDEDLEDRSEDISDAMDDIYKVIYKEGLADDLEDADNWDKYEDIQDKLEDLMEDYFDLLEEAEYDDKKSEKENKKDKYKKEIKDPCDILDYSVKIFEDLNDLADNYDDIDDLEDDKKDKKKVDDYFDDLEDAWKYAFKEFDNEEMEEVFGGCDNEDEMEESFDEVEYFFEERGEEFLDFISEKMFNMREESYDYEGETEKDYYEDEVAEEIAYDGGWPEDEQRAFMENCVIEGVTTVDYCSCMLEKVLKRYPEPEDALNMDMEWMMKEAQDCL